MYTRQAELKRLRRRIEVLDEQLRRPQASTTNGATTILVTSIGVGVAVPGADAVFFSAQIDTIDGKEVVGGLANIAPTERVLWGFNIGGYPSGFNTLLQATLVEGGRWTFLYA